MFAFLAEHLKQLFPEQMFADLFPSGRGRPSVPPEVMASVILLQTLFGLSDSETTDAVTFDLRHKTAIGWLVTAAAFHDTTLTYWHRRLAASSDPNRIFAAVQQVLAQTGAIRGKTRRALDSTVLDDAVATEDTVTQLIAAVRKVRRQVPGPAQVVARVTSAHDYDDPGKPEIAWNDKAARDPLIDALVRDALAVLEGLAEQGEPPAGPAADAVGLLALVAGQDVELVDPSTDAPSTDAPSTDAPSITFEGSCEWRAARGYDETQRELQRSGYGESLLTYSSQRDDTCLPPAPDQPGRRHGSLAVKANAARRAVRGCCGPPASSTSSLLVHRQLLRSRWKKRWCAYAGPVLGPACLFEPVKASMEPTAMPRPSSTSTVTTAPTVVPLYSDQPRASRATTGATATSPLSTPVRTPHSRPTRPAATAVATAGHAHESTGITGSSGDRLARYNALHPATIAMATLDVAAASHAQRASPGQAPRSQARLPASSAKPRATTTARSTTGTVLTQGADPTS